MIHYTNEQLATIIALPTITIVLIWTVAIFHTNRKKWGPYDIPIVAVLVLSIIRNLTILSYLLFLILGSRDNFNLEYCSVIVWIFNSIHTFQASSLTTIAIIGLFSVKLHRKQQNLKMFLTPTHIIYHLFCLTTLCACVGVAAILAQTERESIFDIISPVFEVGPCRFMPFNLDIKFNVFILVLHLFLAVISLFSFLIICFTFYRVKDMGFDYLKKSTSDLSDMSISNTLNVDHNKSYYDTYAVHKNNYTPDNHYYDQNHLQNNNPHLQNGYCGNRDINWNSDLSNMSTTVSSTNSRRPCLAKSLQEKEESENENRTGLETIHPVLIVCYLFYHLPLIVLCICPKLIHPWPVAGIALWLGLIQDLLIPIGLGIVDSRFCKWVSNVYRCSGNNVEEKLPHVGLDGKFRPFGTSQPQSLEIPNVDRSRVFQTVEHRFPLTNGSLYTSIDGRLPVIHNYRRNKETRGPRQPLEKQSSNVALHSSHLNRHDVEDSIQKLPSCNNCELDLCPSHSNLHHLAPNYINEQLNLLQKSQNQNLSQYDQKVLQNIQSNRNLPLGRKVLPDRVSHSQESLNMIQDNRHFPCRNSDVGLNNSSNNYVLKNSRNLVRLNKMRLSKSEDSLNDLQVRELANIPRQNPVIMEPLKQQIHRTKVEFNIQNGYSSSDDDYLTDINGQVITNSNTNNENDNFDSLSSKSCYSITTEANGDFEFFQSNDKLTDGLPSLDTHNSVPSNDEFYIINNVNNRPIMTSFKPINVNRNNSQTDLNRNFRITRSNSKRSLENFHAFVEVEQVDLNFNKPLIQRSNSYIIEDRCKGRNGKKLLRSDSKLSDCSHQFNTFKQKIKSVEYLPSSNASTIFIEDYNQYGNRRNNRYTKCVGSVPDLKKVFISEFI